MSDRVKMSDISLMLHLTQDCDIIIKDVSIDNLIYLIIL